MSSRGLTGRRKGQLNAKGFPVEVAAGAFLVSLMPVGKNHLDFSSVLALSKLAAMSVPFFSTPPELIAVNE